MNKKAGILLKMGIEPTPKSFKILVTCLKAILKYLKSDIESLKESKLPVLSNFNKLSSKEIDLIKEEIKKIKYSIRECQTEVQKVIPERKRKRLAAFYTVNEGVNLMANITYEFLKERKKKSVVLADPFVGSARTLTTAIQKIGASRIQKVWGVEKFPLSALVAYASILEAINGEMEKVTIIVGDSFKVIPKLFLSSTSPIPKADAILTNPPFTRWLHLDRNYRNHILEIIMKLGYERYLTRRETGLQVLSMFLADFILNDNGLLATVLPASTFYTLYGRGYKKLLREKYTLLGFMDHMSKISFSEDSGFKEVIIVAIKEVNRNTETVFMRLNGAEKDVARIIMRKDSHNIDDYLINIYNLPGFIDTNWLSLLENKKLRKIVVNIFNQGLKNGTLGFGNEILGNRSIVRGVEMYGPDFFFIPNKYWKIIEDDRESIVISNLKNKDCLEINKKFLVKTLRKPSLYSNSIEITSNSYALSIPLVEINELPKDLQYYIKWGMLSGSAKPAINAYGAYWYSHTYKQIRSKKPFGHVFIPDKVDLSFKQRGVFANYSKENISASKNFYIIKDHDGITSKIITSWFNSTIFISTLILLGRRISDTWTRFVENDYLELPLINVNSIENYCAMQIVRNIDNIIQKPLPPLWDQLYDKYRYKLDTSILNAIKIKNPESILHELYNILSYGFESHYKCL